MLKRIYLLDDLVTSPVLQECPTLPPFMSAQGAQQVRGHVPDWGKCALRNGEHR